MEMNNQLEHWVRTVSEKFYELVYEDPWLKEVFASVPRKHITSQQIDFMLGALGGPKLYCGRSPVDAHPHIFVSEEMWQQREYLLEKAFSIVDCPASIRERWLRIEEAFKRSIVMKDQSECKKRYSTDVIISVPNPSKKAA